MRIIYTVPSANDTLHTAPKLTDNRKHLNNLFRTSDPKREVPEEPELKLRGSTHTHHSFQT